MANVIPFGPIAFSGLGRGRSRPMGLVAWSVNRVPTDPVGVTTVTFVGVNANSEIRVSLADTTELAGVELCTDDPVLIWDTFSYGSANNNVRIVIIHPDYKIKEFSYTSVVGNQSIPVQQELDKWYSNPA